MIIHATIIVCTLLGLLFVIAAVRQMRRRRIVGAVLRGTSALALFLIAACALLLALGLRGYSALSGEQAAAQIQFNRAGDRRFDVVLTYPSGQSEKFTLRGDDWQVDGRVLKWNRFANILGFDALYRLERIGGRYDSIADERSAPRTVYALHAAAAIDVWELARRYRDRLPWVDALYGSATFLPMADGAVYEISVSQSGLLARPLNQAASKAIGGWH